MTMTCKVCRHKDRDAINRALVDRVPFYRIAELYGASKSGLIRHFDKCIPELLLKAKEAEEVMRADDILGQIRELTDRARALLDRAENEDDIRPALGAIREIRGNLELLGKMQGQLSDTTNVNVFLSQDWLDVQTAIVQALAPYSDARQAVVAALDEFPHVGHA